MKKKQLGNLLKSARKQVREGSVAYIDVELRYYGVCSRPEQLSDSEWASAYAILESVRNREKQETIAAGRLHIPH